MSLTSGIDAGVNLGNVIGGLLSNRRRHRDDPLAGAGSAPPGNLPGRVADRDGNPNDLRRRSPPASSSRTGGSCQSPACSKCRSGAGARRPGRDAGGAGHGRRDLGRRGRRLPHRHVIRAQTPTAGRRPGVRASDQRHQLPQPLRTRGFWPPPAPDHSARPTGSAVRDSRTVDPLSRAEVPPRITLPSGIAQQPLLVPTLRGRRSTSRVARRFSG
jgi:hypothetical protein